MDVALVMVIVDGRALQRALVGRDRHLPESRASDSRRQGAAQGPKMLRNPATPQSPLDPRPSTLPEEIVTTALLCVAAAAICAGTATILQAVAARRIPVSTRLDVALVWRLARSGTYLVALALAAAGFTLTFVALRTLPLFLVQAGRASSLAVAAVLAAVVFGARLRWIEVGALGAIGAGLVVLAISVAPQPASAIGTVTRWALLGAVLLVGVIAVFAVRARPVAAAGLVLGGLAGVAFAMLAVGARTVRDLSPAVLVGDPVAWAMVVAGALGLALSVLALQRAPVVAVTALMVGLETCLGAGLGMALAGDRPAPGESAQTALAFVLVLVGALVVARFGSPDHSRTPVLDSSDGVPRANEPNRDEAIIESVMSGSRSRGFVP
jgi:drug/metabolite transporter (DMT)-like permease